MKWQTQRIWEAELHGGALREVVRPVLKVESGRVSPAVEFATSFHSEVEEWLERGYVETSPFGA